MNRIYKYGLVVAVLSVFLGGCSTTKTNDIATMSSNNIATGSINNRSIQGSSLKIDSKVPRVF